MFFGPAVLHAGHTESAGAVNTLSSGTLQRLPKSFSLKIKLTWREFSEGL